MYVCIYIYYVYRAGNKTSNVISNCTRCCDSLFKLNSIFIIMIKRKCILC